MDSDQTSRNPLGFVGIYRTFKSAVKELKRNLLALNYALQDPECSIAPKLIGGLTLAYALSPIDLIPDFIPVLGLVDDLVLLPAMLYFAIWLLPDGVMERGRRRADDEPLRLSENLPMALLICIIWNITLYWGLLWGLAYFNSVADIKIYILSGVLTIVVTVEVAWLVHRKRLERRKLMSASEPLLEQEP